MAYHLLDAVTLSQSQPMPDSLKPNERRNSAMAFIKTPDDAKVYVKT